MSLHEHPVAPEGADPAAGSPVPRSGLKKPVRPPLAAGLVLMIRMLQDRVGVMEDASARYGDAVRLQLGPKPLYLFNHPRHAKHVLADNNDNYRKGVGLTQAKKVLGDGLLTSEGERWKAQRRTIQPVFQARRIAARADVLAEEAERLVSRWRTLAGGAPIDIREEMTSLSLGVLGRTLLDTDLEPYASMGHDFEMVQDQAMFEVMSLNMVPQWVPLPGQLRFRKARADLHRITSELTRMRRDNPTPDADDVLTRLINSGAQDADPVAAEARIRDELVTLLLAGHETTASTLSWAFYLLDQHPEVRQRLRQEAIEVLGDRRPTYADLSKLTYTGMVVQEVMRLYPAVWMLARTAKADDDVAGYRVRAGNDVVICPWALHRNPEFWPNAARFEPERFEASAAHERAPYSYLPFGAGPRFCIGNHLGLMEATFVLALVCRELDLRLVPGRRVRPEAMLSLRVKGGLPMTVHTGSV